MQAGCCSGSPKPRCLGRLEDRLFLASFSSSCSILPGLKRKEGNIISSYRSLSPSYVISGLTTTKTSGKSIFCPLGRWRVSHVLQMCQLLLASFRATGRHCVGVCVCREKQGEGCGVVLRDFRQGEVK